MIFLRQISMFSESNSCSQALGMGTLVIEDFQISASSEQYKYPVTRARPNDLGWCITLEDTNPYIQVKSIIINNMKLPIFILFFFFTKP